MVALYQDLSKEWSKAERRDLDKIGKSLEQLKLNLTMLSFMPSKGEDATIQVKYRLLHCELMINYVVE